MLFAHGSGSGRHSPRNRGVADVLNGGEIGTILIDLLTEDEELVDQHIYRAAFSISVFFSPGASRAITEWVGEQSNLKKLPLGYASEPALGAAAALAAAADRPEVARAVVSRMEVRPDHGRSRILAQYTHRVCSSLAETTPWFCA